MGKGEREKLTYDNAVVNGSKVDGHAGENVRRVLHAEHRQSVDLSGNLVCIAVHCLRKTIDGRLHGRLYNEHLKVNNVQRFKAKHLKNLIFISNQAVAIFRIILVKEKKETHVSNLKGLNAALHTLSFFVKSFRVVSSW